MENNYNVVGDHILISNFVKYDRLSQLINAEFAGSDAEEVNLFIDAYSMIKSVYGLDPSQFVDKYSIASCIINACAHYRNFFWTRYRVTTQIWVVYSDMSLSKFEANSFYPQYETAFANNPEMDLFIRDNMDVVGMLCPYIPGVQFILSKYEPGLVFGKVISKYGINKPNIIISKDPWNLQVIANGKDTYMIRPIKKNGEDMSVIIDADNVMSYYANLRKIPSYELANIPFTYLTFIMAATRFPERGIKSLHNITSIAKYISNSIQKGTIPTGTTPIFDLEGLCQTLSADNKCNIKNYDINLRINAIGFTHCMYRYLTSQYSDHIEILNLHDPDSVKRINETYFSKVPLDLMSL